MNPFTNLPFQHSDSDSDMDSHEGTTTTMSHARKPFVSFHAGDGALVWYNSYCDPTSTHTVWWLRLAMEGEYTDLGDLLHDMTLAYDYKLCQVVPTFNHEMDGSMYMGFNVPRAVERAGHEEIMELGGEYLRRVMRYYREHRAFPTPVWNAPKQEWESASGEEGDTPLSS